MGEVISFSRARQTDIFSMFDSVCPALPETYEQEVVDSAARSVGQQTQQNPVSFRSACLLITMVCLIAIAVAHILLATDAQHSVNTGSTDNALESQFLGKKFFSGEQPFSDELVETEEIPAYALKPTADDPPWRGSKEAWIAHIAKLEREPGYQLVILEKQLFALAYPDAAYQNK